mmetsp:Transcript_3759/g.11134  ORF Transcript_3759/g.11134 Transcript_3759/m.11134 type:complete len:264 (-) Transcript_3759:198-989(-)
MRSSRTKTSEARTVKGFSLYPAAARRARMRACLGHSGGRHIEFETSTKISATSTALRSSVARTASSAFSTSSEKKSMRGRGPSALRRIMVSETQGTSALGPRVGSIIALVKGMDDMRTVSLRSPCLWQIGAAWTSVECVLPASLSAAQATGFASTRTPRQPRHRSSIIVLLSATPSNAPISRNTRRFLPRREGAHAPPPPKLAIASSSSLKRLYGMLFFRTFGSGPLLKVFVHVRASAAVVARGSLCVIPWMSVTYGGGASSS